MKFDFDIHESQRLPFVELFARENCNELGQTFNGNSAIVLLIEFRKFMFLCASEIANIRRGKEGYGPLKPIQFHDCAFDDQKNPMFVGYDSPLNAGPYVDRVWKAMIAYGAQYRKACHLIAQGYIFRRDPRQNHALCLERYNKARQLMYVHEKRTNPFHNVWPVYQDAMEYYNDFVFSVWCPPQLVKNFTEFLRDRPPGSGNISAQWCIQQAQMMKRDFQRQFPPQYQGRPDKSTGSVINMEGNIQNAYFNGTSPQSRGVMLNNCNNFTMPLKFDEYVCQELMVTLDQAQDFIFEYKRFIVLQGLSNN